MYDVAIIGAGVIGTSIARELSRFKLKTILLEKANDVAAGATKANSAIVHAGFDADYRTKKGQYNARGNALYQDWCSELSVPFRRNGSLVCAFSQEEINHLNSLITNGKKLGIPNLEIIDKSRIIEMEPNINPSVVAALWAPTAGITEPWELAIACAENAIENGVEMRLNFSVKSIKHTEKEYTISSQNDFVHAKCVINCAGTHADKIAEMVLEDPGFKINPRRGQYYLLDKSAGDHVNSVIFPVPTKLGKGTLITPTVDGNIIIGPDAEDLDDNSRDATETTADGLNRVKEMANRIVVNIPYNKTITVFSGLRAESDRGDFIIEESASPGFFNVAGIKSPGLSSAPAIAIDLAQMVFEYFKSPEPNPTFNPLRKPRPRLESLTAEEKRALIKKDPRFGNIICRCEMISEGEIIDAIHRKAGGRTLNGIKRRARPGAGRCQGGFCGPRVMAILARELKINIEEVRLEEQNSVILTGSTRD